MTDPAVRAEQLLEMGRYAEAETLLGAALAAEPQDARLHGLLAQAQRGLGRHRDALAHAKALVGLRPDEEWGHRLAAVLLLDLGAADEAVLAARAAVRLAPNQWQTHQVLAVAASETRGGRAEAREAADRAVVLAPGEADAHFASGLAAQRRDDRRTARAAYQRALQLQPTHTAALTNLTTVSRHRRLGRAAQGYAASLALDPQSVVTRYQVQLLAIRLSRRLYVAALASVAVGAVVSGASRGRVGPPTVAVAVLTIAGVAAYVATEWRGVPLGLRRYVAGRLLRDPILAFSTLLTTAMLALAVATSVVPYGFGVALGLLPFLGFANLGLVTAFRRRRPPS